MSVVALLAAAIADAQPRRQPPYWASIDSGRAMMRSGPGRNYPRTWLYLRRDLPVRVLAVYREWRRVRDPDGTTGWMLVTLLSDRRTAIVRGNGVKPLHLEPDERSPVSWRVEPGVVGRLSRCANGWCRLDIGERGGFIRSNHLWGLGRNEVIG